MQNNEEKGSTFGVSEEKTVNKRFFKRSPTNASERCRVAQAPVHDTVVVSYGDRALGFPEVSLPSFGGSRRAVEGVNEPLTIFLSLVKAPKR